LTGPATGGVFYWKESAMGVEYGKDWRIKIGDGGGTEVFDAIGGEGSFDWARASDEIDLSSKDDGIYKSTGYGQQAITFSISGKVKLPDAGLERADTVSKSSPPEVNIQVVKGAVIKFEGRVAIGNFSCSFPSDGPATYSFAMKNVGAPVTDDLGATS
jgi:predicted secreted protein